MKLFLCVNMPEYMHIKKQQSKEREKLSKKMMNETNIFITSSLATTGVVDTGYGELV